MTTQLEQAENNARAVVLSEELDFLDALLALGTLDPEELRLTLDRRDVVRDALITIRTADPNDDAAAGMSPPPDGTSEDAYEDEDELEVKAEDEDHDYVANRAMMGTPQQVCVVCGEPPDEHEDDAI